jgi:hypothetical protein
MLKSPVGSTRLCAALESVKAGESACMDAGRPFPFAFAISHSLPESVGRVFVLMLCDTYTLDAVGVELL